MSDMDKAKRLEMALRDALEALAAGLIITAAVIIEDALGGDIPLVSATCFNCEPSRVGRTTLPPFEPRICSKCSQPCIGGCWIDVTTETAPR